MPASENLNSPESNNNMSSVIFNRVNHCAFSYKNCIYFYGGQQDSQNKLSALKPKADVDEKNIDQNQNLSNIPQNPQGQITPEGRK